MAKKIFIVVICVLVGIQLFPSEKNSGNASTPQDITHVVNVPENVMTILKTSCYDCHSNHTEYPWYNKVNPIGWWLGSHVEEGKEHLNFSEFAKYNVKKQDHKLEEVEETIKEHEMPLSSYTLIHQKAKLSQEQIQILSEWVKQERSKLKK